MKNHHFAETRFNALLVRHLQVVSRRSREDVRRGLRMSTSPCCRSKVSGFEGFVEESHFRLIGPPGNDRFPAVVVSGHVDVTKQGIHVHIAIRPAVDALAVFALLTGFLIGLLIHFVRETISGFVPDDNPIPLLIFVFPTVCLGLSMVFRVAAAERHFRGLMISIHSPTSEKTFAPNTH